MGLGFGGGRGVDGWFESCAGLAILGAGEGVDAVGGRGFGGLVLGDGGSDYRSRLRRGGGRVVAEVGATVAAGSGLRTTGVAGAAVATGATVTIAVGAAFALGVAATTVAVVGAGFGAGFAAGF